MQREAPWVKRPPSAYVREHVRITTQPLDRPRSDERMLDELQQMPSAGILMFSSDYPHRHAADVDKFLLSLPDDYRRAIASGNALDAYGDRLLVSDLKK
jgi:predicted TIM-barrel fold metal-dependent hydrolase